MDVCFKFMDNLDDEEVLRFLTVRWQIYTAWLPTFAELTACVSKRYWTSTWKPTVGQMIDLKAQLKKRKRGAEMIGASILVSVLIFNFRNCQRIRWCQK